MGVPGLSKYILNNSELFMEQYKLCDCYLIVDGNNVASYLFDCLLKGDSAFGGDYDEIYNIIKKFFSKLILCNVTPIVLLDGGRDGRKLKTQMRRAEERLSILRDLCKRNSSINFHPIFLMQTFCDVMEELDILCLRCDGEADAEIAEIARKLNCPILSNDSDFYIFNVLYIPMPSISKSLVKMNDKCKYYFSCSLFDPKKFLNEFQFDESMLPVIAAILGNDFTAANTFENIFNHVRIYARKSQTYNQRKIHGVLHWLKSENPKSAIKQILNYVPSSKTKKVNKSINICINHYTNYFVSEFVAEELTKKIEGISLNKKSCPFNLPSQLMSLYSKCKIHSNIVNMIRLRTYFSFIQVEYVHKKASDCPCLQLIAHIYKLLAPYLQGTSKPLKMYLVAENQYKRIILNDNISNVPISTTIEDLLKEPPEVRCKWFYYILGFDKNDVEIVPKSNWSIFILSLIYWMKKLHNCISLSHIHALILMAIANQVIQERVGYFVSCSEFKKSKGKLLNKLQNEPLGESKDFKEMLQNVTLHEKLLIQSILFPFRQTTEGAQKSYCILTIDLFNAFQDCLNNIIQLNVLFNYPLPHLKICNFYSGTLLFNFYINIKNKNKVEKFGCDLLKDAPNIMALYTYLHNKLCDFSEKNFVILEKEKSRKKKKNKCH